MIDAFVSERNRSWKSEFSDGNTIPIRLSLWLSKKQRHGERTIMLKVFTGNETANTFSSAVEVLLLNTPNANTACMSADVLLCLWIL